MGESIPNLRRPRRRQVPRHPLPVHSTWEFLRQPSMRRPLPTCHVPLSGLFFVLLFGRLLGLLPGLHTEALAAEIHVPADFSTIQAALDAAAVGDTVTVAPGTYTGAGNTDLEPGRDLLLRSTGGPEVTTIDCAGNGRGLYFKAGETAACRVEGFRIIGGAVTGTADGGGIACVGASPTLVRCFVQGNTTQSEGGGVFLRDSQARLEECLISGNYGVDGGGLFARDSDIVLSQCSVVANWCEDRGGGVHLAPNAVCEFDRTLLWYNCADNFGQDLGAVASGTHVEFTCCAYDPGRIFTLFDPVVHGPQVNTDPLLCEIPTCFDAPTPFGTFDLGANSPCRAEASPCGERIGAREVGCEAQPYGACCFEDWTCALYRPINCDALGGTYIGDGVPCLPSPCLGTAGACCFTDGTCVVLTEGECLGPETDHFRPGETCDPNPCEGLVLRVPSEYPTIQEAIDACFDRDTVLVAAGVYTGPGNCDLEFRGTALNLVSEEGRDVTILDCEGSGRGLYFKTGEPRETVVDGFTIRNAGVTGSGKGAGIACVQSSSPTIVRCSFIDGTAESGGAGLYSAGSSPRFMECEFLDNVAGGPGGAVWSIDSPIEFVSCDFGGNESLAGLGGGAGYLDKSEVLFVDCGINGNEASLGGGLRVVLQSNVVLTDCLVSGNEGRLQGGGFIVDSGSSLTLDGCTVTGNRSDLGGGIRAWSASLTRSVLWDNCADQGAQAHMSGGLLSVTCSDVDSAGVFSVGGVEYDPDTIFSDPIFCAPRSCEDAPILPADYGLAAGSPCLPANSPCGQRIGALGESCVDPEVAGACCFAGGVCQVRYPGECESMGGTYFGDGSDCDPVPCLGACCFADDSCAVLSQGECDSAGGDCWRVDLTCDPSPCPSTFRVPSEVATIQEAIEAACSGDRILVAPGTYTGPGFRGLDPGGKDVVIESEAGSAETILDIAFHGRAFQFTSGESEACVLRGFTIRRGWVGESLGGGMLIDGASPTIEDCVIEDCESSGLVSGRGGGVGIIRGAAPTFLRCTIQDCIGVDDSGAAGGGVYVHSANPTFRECLFARNRGDTGGGVYLGNSAAKLIDCRIIGNRGWGAALVADESPGAVIEGCTIAGNFGGSYVLAADTLRISRTLLSNNWSDCDDEDSPTVWSFGEITFQCCAVDTNRLVGSGTYVFEDIVHADPLFCDPDPCANPPLAAGDYSLDALSPCLPLASPCGELIGALGVGCPVSGLPPEDGGPGADPDSGPVPLPTHLELRVAGPYSGTRSIEFELDLPTASRVRAELFDVRGAVVRRFLDERLTPGTHRIRGADGSKESVASGVYFLRVLTETGELRERVVIVR